MASRLYRCTNGYCAGTPAAQQFEFTPTADCVDPACPKCGTKASDPKHGHIIVPLMRTHYDPPSHVQGQGMGHRACNPSKAIQVGDTVLPGTDMANPMHAGTGYVLAVNCPECKASDVWRRDFAAMHGDVEDLPNATKATLERLGVIRPEQPAPEVAPIETTPEPAPTEAPATTV